MTKGGDKPLAPRCNLGRLIDSAHDVGAIKADLFWRQHHLWVDLNDPDLTPEQRNSAKWLGRQLYPREGYDNDDSR